jgi:hypothetical protein
LLLLGYLSRAAIQGLHVQARWEDARQYHLADFTAGMPRPELSSETRPQAIEAAAQDVTVLFTRAGQTAQAISDPQRPLQQGFTVNEHTWQRLRQLAEHILVESTDASRRHGAGGGGGRGGGGGCEGRGGGHGAAAGEGAGSANARRRSETRKRVARVLHGAGGTE